MMGDGLLHPDNRTRILFLVPGIAQKTREQLIQSPVKMGQLMHSPMEMEQVTLPRETREQLI